MFNCYNYEIIKNVNFDGTKEVPRNISNFYYMVVNASNVLWNPAENAKGIIKMGVKNENGSIATDNDTNERAQIIIPLKQYMNCDIYIYRGYESDINVVKSSPTHISMGIPFGHAEYQDGSKISMLFAGVLGLVSAKLMPFNSDYTYFYGNYPIGDTRKTTHGAFMIDFPFRSYK